MGGGYVLGLQAPVALGFGGDQPLGAAGFWYAAITSFALASLLVGIYFDYVSRTWIKKPPSVASQLPSGSVRDV